MKRIGLAIIALAVGGFLGCQKAEQSDIGEKLDQIDKRLASIEKQIKSGGGRGAARPQRKPGPDPKKVYSASIKGAAWRGVEHAKVTVVGAMEFAWPYCEKVRATLNQLLEDYKGDIKIVDRHYIIHPQSATKPAHAACAANMQGKYQLYADLLWEKGYKKGRNYSPENIDKLAQEAGLDMIKFKADMAGPCPKIVVKDQQELARIGTRGTPAFYINGRFLSGARPIHFFKQIIDQELKKANAAIAKGTPVEKYYDEFVFKKGAKKL